jgi:hypothetical protein
MGRKRFRFGRNFMRAFIVSVVAALAIAIGSYYVLNTFQRPADMAVKIDSVRL